MAPKIDLAGRTIVVTGAASGMGRELVRLLSGRGCPVAAFDWDEDGLAETVDMLDGPVLSRKLDVRDRQAQMAAASDVRDWAPAPIGAVFNNAGVTTSQFAADAAHEDDEWVIDVNFWGVIHGTRAYLPILIEQDSGVIVNTSSVFGLVGFPTQSAYCASKAAVKNYTESLRHELRGTGVGAIAVHPGGVATNIVNNARFHVDDRGNTDHEVLKQDFNKIARTSSEKAAKIIVRGVERGKDRILIGPDAVMLAALLRVAPVRYYSILKRLEPIVRR
jgi:NADP-dependent 3-hydroxy acid dehydrogenase YdfG